MSKLTQQAIMSAFMELLKTKSLDKITVKDVIEAAQINRNTFYYYYDNIYDLLDALFRKEAEDFASEATGLGTFYDEYSRAAAFLVNNKAAVENIYNSRSKDVLTQYLERASKVFVGFFVRRAAKQYELSEEGTDYIISFYSYAIIGNTMHWIRQGMPDYSEQLLFSISKSFEATVDVVIRDYIANHMNQTKEEKCLTIE